MFQINHTTHSPARMPDAARMGNQGEEGAGGVDKGAGADAGEDDDARGGDGDAFHSCPIFVTMMMIRKMIKARQGGCEKSN